MNDLIPLYANAKRRIAELERENTALRADVYQCPPTSENSYEGFKWSDACEELERENAELRKDKKRLDWFAKYYTYKPMPLDDYRTHVDKLIEEMESKKEEAYPWANIWSNPTQ